VPLKVDDVARRERRVWLDQADFPTARPRFDIADSEVVGQDVPGLVELERNRRDGWLPGSRG
jgi:hypothetical protein